MSKKIILIIIVLIIVSILLFPIKFYMDDGGSYGYNAVLYSITFHRQGKDLNPDAEHGNSLRVLFFRFYWSIE